MRRQRCAIGAIELPRHTPLVAAQLRGAAGEFDGGRVEMGEQALGIGRVDRHRQRVHHLAKSPFALLQRGFGAFAFGDVTRRPGYAHNLSLVVGDG